MRLVADGYSVSGRRTGIGRYTAEVLKAAAARDDLDVAAVLFANNPDGPADTDDLALAGVRLHRPHARRFDIFRYGNRAGIGVPFDLIAPPCDVVLYPAFRWYRTRRPSITVVHDLAHLVVPDAVMPGYAPALRAQVEQAVARSSLLGVVSATVGEELVARYPSAAGRIACIPNAASLHLVPPEPAEVDRRLAALGLARGFALHVGTLEPRKAIGVLVVAAAGLPAGVPLVLAGARGWGDDGLVDAIARAGERVRHLAFVHDEDLRALYAGAGCLVSASRYEGFNLPLVEAMRAGCPVVCSDIPVHREVTAGAAVFLADPAPDAVADAVAALLSDPGRRAELAAAGRVAAGGWSWEASASALAAAAARARSIGSAV